MGEQGENVDCQSWHVWRNAFFSPRYDDRVFFTLKIPYRKNMICCFRFYGNSDTITRRWHLIKSMLQARIGYVMQDYVTLGYGTLG